MDSRESAEMYLETIYILSQKSEAVRKIDVSRYMGYAKPSVTRAIGLLEKRGLVSVDDSGILQLTKEGRQQAKRIYERHTVLTKMFVKLGVDESVAAEDACRIEHYISETTFDAIKKHMQQYG
ncbi:MAG: metal-dependent transcriptional regulator [Ruminococcaceae bacterium]|nr:metal-dependent transcriptional regulator [Oscillospiraceae bacterium]